MVVQNSSMPTTPRKILIVEDDDSIRSVIRLFLARHKYLIFEARNGLEGVGLAKAVRPDLILTDLMLPGIAGTDLIRELRKYDETKNTPIIVMTGGSFELQHEALKAGATTVVQKPLHTNFVRLISSFLKPE